jgi:ketosteroid isomerase-like protein
MKRIRIITLLTLLTLCACAQAKQETPSTVQWDEAATQEVRAQVDKAMAAFAAMDSAGFTEGLAEDVVAYEFDFENKPVRLASRTDAGRFAGEIFAQVKKAGGTLGLDVRSNECRATSTAAYCTVEFDLKVTLPDGKTMAQPSRNTIVVRKGEDGWKWTHWHSSLAALPAPPAQ